MEDSDKVLFESYGVAATALKQIQTNPALGVALKQAIAACGINGAPSDKSVGNLLFTAASSLNDARAHRRDLVVKYIGAGKIKTTQQLNAAVDFLKKKTPDAEIDSAEFEKASGVGIAFTDEQVRARGKEVIGNVADELKSQRYLYPIHTLLNVAKEGDWRWANGGLLKEAVDAAVLEFLGPKNSDDEKREAEAKANFKKGKAAAKDASKAETAAAGGASAAGSGAGTPAGGVTSPSAGSESAGNPSVHAVGAVETVFTARELGAAVNSTRLVEEHLKVTKGVIRTRFPPEPNGFLHIGHAKSMNLNFEGAFKALGVDKGDTVFRYDDTNPDAETKEYIDNMAENVSWMGWKPCATTHSSDYFPQLYAFAVELIKRGKAYVCHQTKEDMEVSREAARARDPNRSPNSPWRDRPVEESLREFDDMRLGRYKEGEATLRLKIDMTSANPTLWDPVAYRIKYTPHPHTGDRWCIYPSYDFSHSLIDSLEHIDYSLCTLEFEVRRELYYWTLEQLDVWRPHVWEFARLNITHVQLSKRKILKLVMEKTVRGWDDPRLPTVIGLRRRGYTAEAINAFCRDIGVTRNDNTVQYSKLEYHVRNHLDQVARRDFVVLRPLKVVLTNVPEGQVYRLTAPDFPRDASLGSHEITLTRTIWIEEEDFREVDDKDYYGLAPGKVAGLRYAGFLKVTGVKKDGNGKVVELEAQYDHDRSVLGAGLKVKGNLHFVSGVGSAPEQDAPVVEVRLYDHLFTTETPGSTGDWESEINRNSETVLQGRANPSLLAPGRVKVRDYYHDSDKAVHHDKFQFERVGYFVADQDSDLTPVLGAPFPRVKKLVFAQTVGLKEASDVKKVKGHA